MYTLGINADIHEGAACLVRDGMVVAAADEAPLWSARAGYRSVASAAAGLPSRAISACLGLAGITLGEVDHAACDLPLPDMLACRGEWHRTGRREALEASACMAAPFDHCAVLVTGREADPLGISCGVWEGGPYRRIASASNRPALASLYGCVALHLGFAGPGGTAKLAALAAYGRPGYVAQFRALLNAQQDRGVGPSPAELAELLGPLRLPAGALEQRHMDIAHSLQRVLEDALLEEVNRLQAQTGLAQLAIAGHFACNAALNASLRARSAFEQLWVQPAGPGASVAIGGAMLADAARRGHRRLNWSLEHIYLGPQYSEQEIETVLRHSKLAYRRCADIARDTAALLSQGKVVGWFQGRMALGAEPLGARSILAPAGSLGTQDRLNEITGRDDFLPLPALVTAEAAGDWFSSALDPPCLQVGETLQPRLAHRIPAVRHVDGTAQVHAVGRDQHGLLHALLSGYGRLTGIPVLAHLPFGMADEALAATPRDALACFCSMPLDALAIGPFLLEKSWLTAWHSTP